MLSYQRDSAEAHRMMADIGNELDLYTLRRRAAGHRRSARQRGRRADHPPDQRHAHRGHQRESLGYSYRNLRAPSADPLSRRRRAARNSAPQRRLAALLISRIKVMASLDIAEKRVPQDGRMALRIGGRAIDVRVSTLPSSHGERVVLRLLDKNSVNLDLLTLGMPPALPRSGRCADRPPARHHPCHRSDRLRGKARRSTPPSAASTPRERTTSADH